MRDVLPRLIDLVREGPVALARVVSVTGGGPRPAGAAMLVTAAGEVVGSLSGGCVESAVVTAATEVLSCGRAVSEHFGVAEPDGIAIGLTCGGELEVFVERAGVERLPALTSLVEAIRDARPVALVTTLTETPEWHVLYPPTGESRAASAVSRDALHLARAGRTGTVGSEECEPAFPPRAFVQSFGPPARMILAGANEFVRALSRLGTQLGYAVTVVDARETFTTAARFPFAREVVVDWPHRYLRREAEAGRIDARTVVCVLTHDSKFDVPMLAEALALDEPVFVGALGSRRTHADRTARLIAAGVGPDRLRRLRSPIGLDLNATTPEETAVSIAAQIIAEVNGASAGPLADRDGPIHH